MGRRASERRQRWDDKDAREDSGGTTRMRERTAVGWWLQEAGEKVPCET